MKGTGVRITRLVAFAIVFAAGPAFGQVCAPQTATTPASGDRAAVIADLTDTATKFIELANSMPAETFTWRPSEHDRSVSELYLCVAGLYFHQPSEFGAVRAGSYELDGNAASAGLEKKIPPFEKRTTDKKEVVDWLIDARAYFKGIMPTLSDDDWKKTIKLNGRDITANEGLFEMAAELHGCMSQALTYARAKGVSPPWPETASERDSAH